ncbi:Transmembrane protein 81 Precursor [Channa argus]|uniref:Transmembrane protein 81 n=1 Tax=Channa argus TaxID=215402 RepID=A0A6G1Q573_CHAAH|nr:Transmembrane protein 81 Precursor [Channa argus]
MLCLSVFDRKDGESNKIVVERCVAVDKCWTTGQKVTWRYARGVISSDDSLFARWEAPQLDRVILDPVHEEDAGTYRCDVQDATFHRVKSIYWGIRVLPTRALNLDYESTLAQWESRNQQNQTVSEELEERMALISMQHVHEEPVSLLAGSSLVFLSDIKCTEACALQS